MGRLLAGSKEEAQVARRRPAPQQHPSLPRCVGGGLRVQFCSCVFSPDIQKEAQKPVSQVTGTVATK